MTVEPKGFGFERGDFQSKVTYLVVIAGIVVFIRLNVRVQNLPLAIRSVSFA